MVNGNYVLYGDRPSSESEIVDDHVHQKTAERKPRRKTHRTANELQSTLNMAQLDNETDSVKYEKRIQEPRLLRYVPTTEVEENYVSEKFETYDLKPAEERPRRYAFTKKPKNPADGSVNYAYSRSSSSCSSPNGNLPTISEHTEQYGTYRVRPAPSPPVVDIIGGYESKLDKYFAKPRELKKFAAKVNYNGSHPDSLYRVSSVGGAGAGKMARVLQLLRWPAALVLVCVALAVFVYFLMPDNLDSDLDSVNGTYWDPAAASIGTQIHNHLDKTNLKPDQSKNSTPTQPQGTKTPEIDFYEADTAKAYDTPPHAIPTTESNLQRNKLPIQPVFPTHITPEVQYGNEKADSDKLRNAKQLGEANAVTQDSTLKPHITQKPEKPLAIFVKDNDSGNIATSTESIEKDTFNDLTNYGEKVNAKKTVIPIAKLLPPVYKEQITNDEKTVFAQEPEIPQEIQEFYQRKRPAVVDVKFTSGHSKLFGISIEDAANMHSTTQSSTYNTRVSPTLPTWRNRDDSTTKKYPVNVNYDVPQCRSTRLAYCSGVLPYDLAGPAATLNGVDLTQLLSQVEYLTATNCSGRLRQFMCALLEPECNPPPQPPKMPCYNFCKAITDSCEGLITHDLAAAFNCNQYSSANCVAAKSPCSQREFFCGDGSCIPRDWICDGARDCVAGEDEQKCVVCDENEYRCQSGGCIQKRWMCDGYSDCPGGEDESPEVCETYGLARPELGEDAAGSAPAPSVHRPHRVHAGRTQQRLGDIDSSKELLMTSDSNNALKRNYTRRPPLSRLTPYTRPKLQEPASKSEDVSKIKNPDASKQVSKTKTKGNKAKTDSMEDVNIGDLPFFEDLDREGSEKRQSELKRRTFGGVSPGPEPDLTHLDKSINKLEKVIDGASLLRKAVNQQDMLDSPESNSTTLEMSPVAEPAFSGSAHASPCPSGELRCVDGRCITLAQLCDGTIDCSDHADEDNCYT